MTRSAGYFLRSEMIAQGHGERHSGGPCIVARNDFSGHVGKRGLEMACGVVTEVVEP